MLVRKGESWVELDLPSEEVRSQIVEENIERYKEEGKPEMYWLLNTPSTEASND